MLAEPAGDGCVLQSETPKEVRASRDAHMMLGVYGGMLTTQAAATLNAYNPAV